jgi:zinc and cadmium transporter
MVFWYIVLATFFVSLISLVGLIVAAKKIKTFLSYFVAFSAGSLIAASLFDLIPESLKEVSNLETGLFFLGIGTIFFFLVESFIHWRHCGEKDCHKKPTGALVFSVGMIHNFTDGLLIAGAFLLNPFTGIITTILVAIHEIPHEFGDFALFLHSGYSKWEAVKVNFISGISAILGGILGFLALDKLNSVVGYVVLLAAGGFLYIALSDIVPELHDSKEGKKKFFEAFIFVASFFLMKFFLKLLGV